MTTKIVEKFVGGCPECKGAGEVLMAGQDEPDFYDNCPYCGGHGIKCTDCGNEAVALVADGTEHDHLVNDRFLCEDCLRDMGIFHCDHCGKQGNKDTIRYYADGVLLCDNCIAEQEGLNEGNEKADRAEANAMQRADREQIAILNGGEV